jgi:hypothetical protein
MSNTFDEELARSREIGTLTHQVIASLLPVTSSPTPEQITAAVNAALPGYAPIEARAHRQNIAGAVGSYFWRLLPPPQWLFHGAEVHLGLGRVDLLWVDFDERILLDEIKTGHPRDLQLSSTREQITSYGDCARLRWADRYVGIRVLSTRDPRKSQLVTPNGHWKPLFTTNYQRST